MNNNQYPKNNDLFEPWNDPMKKDDPFACWNDPFGHGDYRDECISWR
jgi:hypothetical protein